jgi:hypothetical protein
VLSGEPTEKSSGVTAQKTAETVFKQAEIKD